MKTFRGHGGLRTTTRTMPQQMCEKVWTLPAIRCLSVQITMSQDCLFLDTLDNPLTQSAFVRASRPYSGPVLHT